MTPRRFGPESVLSAMRDEHLNRPGRFGADRNRLTVLTVREDGPPGRFPGRSPRPMLGVSL
jgi:hypothetical protein